MLQHELSDAVGAQHTSVEPSELTQQAADWSWMAQLYTLHDLELPTADVLVRPGTPDEVAAVLRIATDHRVPVIPRGGGSGTQGGTFAL
jgi:alkyldihydroxyacetonephosphate synthase